MLEPQLTPWFCLLIAFTVTKIFMKSSLYNYQINYYDRILITTTFDISLPPARKKYKTEGTVPYQIHVCHKNKSKINRERIFFLGFEMEVGRGV